MEKKKTKKNSDTNVHQLSGYLGVGGKSAKSMSAGRLTGWTSVALDLDSKKWDICINYFKSKGGILDAQGCHRQCDRTKDLELQDGSEISAASCVALHHVYPGDALVNNQNKSCKGKIGVITRSKDEDGKKMCKVFPPIQFRTCSQ